MRGTRNCGSLSGVSDQVRTIVGDVAQDDPDQAARLLAALLSEHGSATVVAAVTEVSSNVIKDLREQLPAKWKD